MRLLRYLLPLLVLGLIGAGCASVAKPEGWARPELTDDSLYVSLDDGEMSAVDPETYDRIWTFPADDSFVCGGGSEEDHDLDAIYGTPAIGDDLVYIGAYDSNVYALTKEDGNCEWQFDTGDWIVGGPVLGDSQLYVPSSDGYLYILDPETGSEIDRVTVGDVWTTPLLTETGELYVGTMDGKLWKFSTEGGELTETWEKPFQVSTGILTDPTPLGEDTIIVGGIGETLYAVDAATGEEKWSFKGRNWFWGEPVGDGASIFSTSLGGKVYANDSASGEELWSFETENPVRAGAVVVDGTVVAVDNRGIVNLLDPATGEALQPELDLKNSVFATPLALEDSVLIVSRSGKIFSINVEDGSVQEVLSD